MAEQFNPYAAWLGLPPNVTNPSHYQLLDLSPAESSSERISMAADRAIARVRSSRPGVAAEVWADLIDQLLEAKTTLLDPARRAQYDQQLASGTAPNRPTISASPAAAATSGEPKPSDFRYPPGMGPKPASAESKPSRQTASTTTADKPSAPQQTVAQQPAPQQPAMPQSQPAPQQNVNPYPAGGYPGQPAPYYPPQQPMPAAGYPQGNYYPQPPGAYPQQPGYYPPAAPQPGYPQAGGYPAPSYAQPGMGQPGMPPAPGYPQAYAPQGQAPQGYASPYPSSPYVAMPASGMSPSAPPPPPRSADAFDPMAPVAIPGMGTPGTTAPMSSMGAPMGGPAPYTAARAVTAMPVGTVPTGSIPTGSIPQGTAMPAEPTNAVSSFGSGSNSATVFAARREKQSQKMMLIGGSAVAIVTILVLIIIANSGSNSDPIADTSPGAGDTTIPATTPPAQIPPVTTPAVLPPATTPTTPLQPSPMQPTPTTVPPAIVPPTVLPSPAAPEMMDPDAPSPQPVPETAPMIPETPTSPTTPMPETMVPAPAVPVPTTPPAPTPEPPAPVPTPEAAPAAPMVTAAELAALTKAVTDARDALSEAAFDEAQPHIEKAKQLAKLPEHQAVIDRLDRLANYSKQFYDAIGRGVSKMEAGEVFTVGTSTQVAVVETFSDRIIVRIAGQNRNYPFNELPAGLAVALADFSLDSSDPASRVVKGAYLVLNKKSDTDAIAKARTWWEEAQLSGTDLTDLMPALTEKYEFKAPGVEAPAKTTKPAGEEDLPF